MPAIYFFVINVCSYFQRYMLRKALRVGARHEIPPHLRWICNQNGQDYILNTDLVDVLPEREADSYSSNDMSHDPISCLGRAYRENILSSALYNVMSPPPVSQSTKT